jgi:hypothetical protein
LLDSKLQQTQTQAPELRGVSLLHRLAALLLVLLLATQKQNREPPIRMAGFASIPGHALLAQVPAELEILHFELIRYVASDQGGRHLHAPRTGGGGCAAHDVAADVAAPRAAAMRCNALDVQPGSSRPSTV